jgi:hypothetical protein
MISLRPLDRSGHEPNQKHSPNLSERLKRRGWSKPAIQQFWQPVISPRSGRFPDPAVDVASPSLVGTYACTRGADSTRNRGPCPYCNGDVDGLAVDTNAVALKPPLWVPLVSTTPGVMVLTRIFFGPSSRASTPVMASTAPLVPV